ncbi:hypothetical protein CMI47_22720 [Candidatus Pacearchaeota archaeon]|nr:hypothetical protein [Candidatus Pacearchaeota archaeon]|tara:strand:- start:51 stop:371 length:321 start_codon:yes stop_codon:yes gene_type:complete
MINLFVILITLLIIEIITLIPRFVFKLKSTKVHDKIKNKLGLTKIIRVHHLFYGLLIALIALILKSNLFINIGLGIALSDIVHHIILKIATGNSEFHLTKDWIIKD